MRRNRTTGPCRPALAAHVRTPRRQQRDTVEQPNLWWSCEGVLRTVLRKPRPARDLEHALADLCQSELCHCLWGGEEVGPAERRGSVRVAVAGPVRFRTIECESVRCGWLRNVSRGGGLVESPDVPAQNALLAIGFCVDTSAGNVVVRSMAQVCWTDPSFVPGDHGPSDSQRQLPGAFGLRFLELPREMADSLDRLIRNATRRAEPVPKTLG